MSFHKSATVDIAEICGFEAQASRPAGRRIMRRGPNFDLVVGVGIVFGRSNDLYEVRESLSSGGRARCRPVRRHLRGCSRVHVLQSLGLGKKFLSVLACMLMHVDMRARLNVQRMT